MSNPIPMNPASAGQPEGGEPKAKKKSIVTRLINGARNAYDKVMKTKVGRIAVRTVEGAAAGLCLYGAYKKGQKSVKPTTIYISNGVEETEDEEELQAEEPAVEETNDETVEETTEV